MPETNLPNTPVAQPSYNGGQNVPAQGTPEYDAAAKMAATAPKTGVASLSSNAEGMNPDSFGALLGSIGQKAKYNNALATTRASLLKHLYDSPLTPEEMAKLPTDVQNVISTGDKNSMELQVRVINDQLQGRAQTLDKVVQSLTTGYQNSQINTKNAMQEILAYAQSTGKPIADVAKALAPIYGVAITDQLMKTLNTLGAPLLKTTQVAANSGVFGEATSTISNILGTDPTQPLTAVIDSTGIDKVVDAIIQNEGSSPSGVQNNPGNIKFTGLPGQTDSGVKASDGGTFANYNTPDEGRQAIASIVQNAADSKSSAYGTNPTLGSFIDTYTNTAPDRSVNANPPDPSTANVPSVGGYTPNAVYQDALEYLFTGKSVQSFIGGLSNSGDAKTIKSAITNKAAAIAAATGTSFPAYQALYKANASAAKQNVERVARVESIAKTMALNIPRLQQLADKLNAAGVNITESDFQAGKAAVLRKFGSEDAAAYVDLVNTIRGDYAATQAALAGSRGGQFFAETAGDAIPSGLTSGQYGTIMDTIIQSSDKARQAINDEVQSLIGASGSTGGTPGGNASTTDIKALAQQKGFDYDKAKAAGYSDAEITGHLNSL